MKIFPSLALVLCLGVLSLWVPWTEKPPELPDAAQVDDPLSVAEQLASMPSGSRAFRCDDIAKIEFAGPCWESVINTDCGSNDKRCGQGDGECSIAVFFTTGEPLYVCKSLCPSENAVWWICEPMTQTCAYIVIRTDCGWD